MLLPLSFLAAWSHPELSVGLLIEFLALNTVFVVIQAVREQQSVHLCLAQVFWLSLHFLATESGFGFPLFLEEVKLSHWTSWHHQVPVLKTLQVRIRPFSSFTFFPTIWTLMSTSDQSGLAPFFSPILMAAGFSFS